eukprot:TRINITY_DN1518_c0_g1_i4.p1 TRINITY_DN1518_c0_g1~~TRINITY_DN1518_c0_g1_i4.p1  ORF type:complete len:270 (-),score=77.49 TRINITY_DN1518_c0_g1_i4:724-1533(-)
MSTSRVGYGDAMSMPCRGCGVIIKDAEEAKLFEDRRWHVRCFVCQTCKQPFVRGKVRPQAAKGLPFCENCIEEAKAIKCGFCKETILHTYIEPKGVHKKFHPNCFRCDACKQPIAAAFKKRLEWTLCVKCSMKSNADIQTAIDETKMPEYIPDPDAVNDVPAAANDTLAVNDNLGTATATSSANVSVDDVLDVLPDEEEEPAPAPAPSKPVSKAAAVASKPAPTKPTPAPTRTSNDAGGASSAVRFCGECGAKREPITAKFCGDCGGKY